MIRSVIRKILGIKEVSAHCDIPCGIYLPQPAQTAAETVEKMVQKIKELAPPASADVNMQDWLDFENSSSRFVRTKEDHAEFCKRELLILWTDYFKEEHLEMFPDLHEKFWKAAKLCSKNKREVNMEAARELRKAVDEIAEMFEKTKRA